MTYKKLYMAPWVGSKFYIASELHQYIPNEYFNRWAEPFGGAGGMLMSKQRWADQEIWNDNHSEMFNLWYQFKFNFDALCEACGYDIKSREVFDYYLNLVPANDVERAARFLYLQNNSFGAKGHHYTPIGKQADTTERFKLIFDRVKGVSIENLDYADFIERYKNFTSVKNSRRSFFFVDPPYPGIAQSPQYIASFDHEKLANIMRTVSDLWIETNADTPEIRELYKGYCIVPYERANRIENRKGKMKNQTYGEIMIANYDLHETYRKNTSGRQTTFNL